MHSSSVKSIRKWLESFLQSIPAPEEGGRPSAKHMTSTDSTSAEGSPPKYYEWNISLEGMDPESRIRLRSALARLQNTIYELDQDLLFLKEHFDEEVRAKAFEAVSSGDPKKMREFCLSMISFHLSIWMDLQRARRRQKNEDYMGSEC